ncbi:hypothetical protein SAMN05878443_0972 [Carnobacterium alterfunditum]|uniref:Uncharacterized protein n=1 Tax=Carnobacterium alterfunditum TaxID=28230 RepID=A0A1N6G1Z7_9LACT|nr:hypothetical protein SAMN05878443_0972 [Carnobacterium alterfunditum]
MKLYIKEKRFSWRNQLIVQDEQNELVYKIVDCKIKLYK